MDVGHVVYFDSQKNPFLIEVQPCLDLECPCSTVTLHFTEIVPPGSAHRECLTFPMRVCLDTWRELDPAPRTSEVETLCREFLLRFPPERIDELVETFEQAREEEQRRQTIDLSEQFGVLVPYSLILCEDGEIRKDVFDYCSYFVFEGQEFYVEDHYCVNPACSCNKVHIEFWERAFDPKKRRFNIRCKVAATFSLTGELCDIRRSRYPAATTKSLLRAWKDHARNLFGEYAQRYKELRSIAARNYDPPPKKESPVRIVRIVEPGDSDPPPASHLRIGRNAPCPCGSGKKYKRCCGRRAASTE